MMWRNWTVVATLFLTMAGPIYAGSSSRSEQETTGVLRGELQLPAGLARPHPFILAYSAAYGEQVIPVEEHFLTARFEIKLKPGIYYLFVALDGYEPTCHVTEIGEGADVVYNPKVGPGIMINDYSRPPVKMIWELPLRRPLRGFELSPRPPK